MKKTPLIIGLISMLILLWAYSPAGAQGELLFQEDFEGNPSAAWELEPGWQIIQEDGNTLLQGQGHSWARINQTFPEDFQLSLRIKVLSGRIHLVTQLNDQGRYYIGLGGELTSLNKQYWPDTFLNDLQIGSRPLPPEVWHAVELISLGDQIQVSVDGEQLWEYRDEDKLGLGGIALETLEGSRVQVDDLVVSALGETPNQVEMEAEEPSPIGSQTAWIRTGGPLGGLGYDVRMSPDNPDKMYVTDAFAGVFISEDGGKNWFPFNQGITDRTGESMDAIPVFCLTIDPSDPEVVWAGTQYSGGIFKSTDGGQSWTRKTKGITLQNGLTFRGISVDPTNSQIVYAAGEISSWAWSGKPIDGREFDLTKGAVYKSENGGESWRQVWLGDNLARYILINPEDPRVIYLSTGIFDREASNSDPNSGKPGGVGVLKSTDGGESWTPVNNGLGNLYVGSLFMHPEDPDILLAGMGNNQYYQESGVYLTTDGAQSWDYAYRGDYMNVNSVEFSASDPQIAYAGENSRIMRSEDGGRTWKIVSGGEDGWGAGGVRGGFPIDFQVDPRDPERIFANNYGGGNFLSEDGGRTWQVASKGYTGAQVRSLAVDPDQPGKIYAAARSGIFLSRDGGSQWTGLGAPPYQDLEWNAVAVDPSNPDHLVAANNWKSNILGSLDGGLTWQIKSSAPGEGNGIRVFAFAPSDPRYVYAGTASYFSAGTFSPENPAKGIYQSSDGGESWQLSTTGNYSDAHIMDLSIASQNHEIVFAASSNYGVLRTQDSGSSWEQVNQGLVMRRGANAVAVHPQNPQVVFAGIASGGVYRTGNGGESWQPSSAGLNPEANITDLVIDPGNPDTIYASDSFSGVYRSLDGGQTWQSFSDNLRLKAVTGLALSADGNHLYAATEGEGVYRIDLNGTPPASAPLPEIAGEAQEEPQPQEGEPVQEENQAEPTESAPPPDAKAGGQVCPGSYLPLAAGLVVFGGWAGIRSNRKRD